MLYGFAGSTQDSAGRVLGSTGNCPQGKTCLAPQVATEGCVCKMDLPLLLRVPLPAWVPPRQGEALRQAHAAMQGTALPSLTLVLTGLVEVTLGSVLAGEFG